MKIKKLRGKSLIDALRKVKEDLGENAVILDSQRIVDNGEEFYEILAAVDEVELSSLPEFSKEKNQSIYQKLEENTNICWKELKEIKEILKTLAAPQLHLKKEIELLRLGIPGFMVERIIQENVNLTNFVKNAWQKKGSTPQGRFRIFIGEAGTGKTSMLFKIAFYLKEKEKKKGSILIVSVDNYKIGGREQFQKMSQLLEIPSFWTDWEEVISKIDELKREYDFILIDTPGIGKKFLLEDLYEISGELRDFRLSWVVKATDEGRRNLELWERLKKLYVDEVLLTFVDKVKLGGPLFWLLDDDLPPVTYFSIGERIPEDILKAKPSDLLALFLRGLPKNLEEKEELT